MNVTLVDDRQGHITATADKAKEDLTFINTYEATGTLDFKGLKTLEYGELEDQEFSFELVQVADDGTETVVETVNEGGSTEAEGNDGEFAFSQITFTKNAEKDECGTYNYIIREFVPADAMNAEGVKYEDATAEQKEEGGFVKGNYRYDSHEQAITVTVEDNGDGTLEVTKDPDAGEGYDAEFNNVKAFTEIVITKDMEDFVLHEGEQATSATLVFQVVDAETEGEKFMASGGIQFTVSEVTSGTTKEVTIEKIPTDIEVKVKEVYASNYEADPYEQELSLNEDGIYTAHFDNKYKNVIYNTGVINQYTKGEEGYEYGSGASVEE